MNHAPASLASLFRAAPLYAIYDTGLRPELSALAVIESWLSAGVRVIQYRHKTEFRRKNFDECSVLAERIRRSEGMFIVNDRADVAALCGADGLHLGQHDLPPAAARRFLPPPVCLGYSTHNREQAAAAADLPVDYLAIGPVFATQSKENPDPVLGLEIVREVRGFSGLPLVGIGGITFQNAAAVLAAGADAVAVISALVMDAATAKDIEARARAFLRSCAANS